MVAVRYFNHNLTKGRTFYCNLSAVVRLLINKQLKNNHLSVILNTSSKAWMQTQIIQTNTEQILSQHNQARLNDPQF